MKQLVCLMMALCWPVVAGESVFWADLSGSQEVPAVQTPHYGRVVAVLDEMTMTLEIVVAHSIANPTAAHVHQGAVGSSGAPVFSLAASSPITASWQLTAAQLTQLLAGNLYINIHTAENPRGEIRGQLSNSAEPELYTVTVTNLTKNQILTPPLAITHKAGHRTFSEAAPAPAALAHLAEDGDNAPLRAAEQMRKDVFATHIADQPVVPGSSVSFQVRSTGPYDRLTVLGMLAQTNDGFFAVVDAQLPQGIRFKTGSSALVTNELAYAYDAGTEANNESCLNIPGPPCGAVGQRAEEDAEGHVHLHSGIHGIGDLDETLYTWQGPVARVQVQKTSALRVRKNAANLTPAEKNDYVQAILTLKTLPSPFDATLSYYDQMVVFHRMAVDYSTAHPDDMAAHMNPTFPPWHRKLLALYERALSTAAGKQISLPYWDWTDPASTAAVFSEDLMGPSGDPNENFAVMSGPFRKGNFTVNVFSNSPSERAQNPFPWLTRAIGHYNTPSYPYPVSLPTVEDVAYSLSAPLYDAAPWNNDAALAQSFRNNLEGFIPGAPCDGSNVPCQKMHNIGHDWVAGGWYDADGNQFIGSLEPLSVSPNDPAFFMHHTNVDRVWALWQLAHPEADQYVSTSVNLPEGQNLADPMYPYTEFLSNPLMLLEGVTPESMLSTEELGYVYQ